MSIRPSSRFAKTRRAAFLCAALLVGALLASQPARAQAPGQLAPVPAFLPGVDAVPATQPLPLDGTYVVNTIRKKIRIEAGRAYAVDSWLHLWILKVEPGMVVMRNITPTAPGEYAGEDLPLMGAMKARVQANRSIVVDVAGSLGPARYVLTPVQLDDPAWYAQEMAAAGLAPAQPLQPAQPAAPPAYQPAPPQGQATPAYGSLQAAPPPGAGSYAAQAAPPRMQPPAPPAYSPPPAPTAVTAAVQLPATASTPSGRGALRSRADSSARPKKRDDQFEPPASGPASGTRIKPLARGPAEKWGCEGKNLYFTPHEGGQCWSCPEGYRRMASVAIWKPNSCEQRGLSFDREDARLERSAYGCPRGQFNRGNQCYECPAGSSKISFAGINPPEKACKVD